MSGRAPNRVSYDRWQRVWWYVREERFSQREIAGHLGISLGTVAHYVAKGLPPYDRRYDTSPVRDDADDDAGRTANVRRQPGRGPQKSYVSRTPPRATVASLDAARRRRA